MTSLKQTAMTVGIAILFTTFIIVTIEAFYSMPEREDFCSKEIPPKVMPDKINCKYEENNRNSFCYQQDMQPIYEFNETGCRVFKECSTCQQDYNMARDKYDRNFFLIIAPLGIIAIILGTLYTIEFIGTGFMYAGI
ncbi:hypothetical protein HN451_04935, partial [archaeon]|nr:hypothetical protein [archaeon]